MEKKMEKKICKKYQVLITLGTFILFFDQVTKILITQRFFLGETLPIIESFFHLTYIQNKGAAFGLFAHADPRFRIPFFSIVPFFALTAMGYVFHKIPGEAKFLVVSFSLVISGALGNLLDRLRLGYVVDFLDFHWGWGAHFPAFNVADSAICVGVGFILFDLFFENKKKSENEK